MKDRHVYSGNGVLLIVSNQLICFPADSRDNYIDFFRRKYTTIRVVSTFFQKNF